MKVHPLTVVCVLASVAGFAFAAVSTADFVAHLDRQVHGIHCSFLPGLGAADTSGGSGCHTTLMSPYSSVFRESVWGGIPVALPGMAVFAFLAFWSLWLIVNRRQRDVRATGFLLAATLVPVLTSAVMGYLSIVALDAACKLCIGIYASSGLAFVAALGLWLSAHNADAHNAEEEAPAIAGDTAREVKAPASAKAAAVAPVAWSVLGVALAVGVAFVAVPVVAYAAKAPDFSVYVGSCGSLPHPNYEPSVLIPLGPQRNRTQMLEVLDPLCPSCKGFEERFGSMEASTEVDRKALLFPLDESCNWMIDHSIHPGACSVSEAVLCADDPAPVLEWAFAHQSEILAAAKKEPGAAERMVREQFPALSKCIGSPEIQAKVNLGLRWAVKNRLQVLTPQVFVEEMRLCGEDTDLGLDYALPRLIARVEAQPRPKKAIDDEEESEERTVPSKKQASRVRAEDDRDEPKQASRDEVEDERRADDTTEGEAPAKVAPTDASGEKAGNEKAGADEPGTKDASDDTKDEALPEPVDTEDPAVGQPVPTDTAAPGKSGEVHEKPQATPPAAPAAPTEEAQ